MLNTGLIHLVIGDGKGKTTAALGLLARAQGAGLRPLLVQFLKGRDTAELASLKKLGIPYFRTDAVKKFIFEMDEQERASCLLSHKACFDRAREAVLSLRYDIVVLDEILDAVNTGMVPEPLLLELLAQRGAAELVLTGRDPSASLQELADYITEVQAIRHPYQRGFPARRGIDY